MTHHKIDFLCGLDNVYTSTEINNVNLHKHRVDITEQNII